MINIYESSFFRRVYMKLFNIFPNISYSQTGEDLLINFFKEAKQIKDFTYLDIGANHPTKFNNTYLFYNKGFNGVAIEPNPTLVATYKKLRKRDVILPYGISLNEENQPMDYYMMDSDTLNTFSKSEALRMEEANLAKILKVVKMNVVTIDSILNKYFKDSAPTFLNIDIEGIDEELIKAWDFKNYRPAIICIETISFTNDATSAKNLAIIEFLSKENYTVFADTYINTIFYDSTKF